MVCKRFGLASPLTTEKVAPTEIFFGARCVDSPFMDLKKTKKKFRCCGFQSFCNSPDEGSLYCSQLRSAADLQVKDALKDFWLTAANTINPGDNIPHVPRISCSEEHQQLL